MVRRIFALGEVILAGSSGSVEYLKSLGISSDRILLGRNVVDNAWWTQRAAETDRDAARASWQIPARASIVLFCAKLQPWKGPSDLLEAFVRANVPESYLVFAGDGPLRSRIEQRMKQLIELGGRHAENRLAFLDQTFLHHLQRDP